MRGMKQKGVRLYFFAWLAMVLLQMAGAHLHIDAFDHQESLDHAAQVEHTIAADHYDHGHDEHLDVFLPDLALKFSSADSSICATGHEFENLLASAESTFFIPISDAPPNRFFRPNPPLRAPPQAA